MIFTFYSYKGGVGRSMALANIAELFYQDGMQVLMVDWDLEAPGLERYFPIDQEEALNTRGLLDMLLTYKTQMAEERKDSTPLQLEKPEDYLIDIYPNNNQENKLLLLTAGRRSSEHFSQYSQSIISFDWKDFYENWEGERYFERLRQEFEKIADVILIDSRTGATEIGGVCTYQMADIVVMFCAPNIQNLHGVYETAIRLTSPKLKELRAGSPLDVIIIPARVDRSDSKPLDLFKKQFLDWFKNIPFPAGLEASQLWENTISYVPKYAFSELVAIREERETKSASSELLALEFKELGTTLKKIREGDRGLLNRLCQQIGIQPDVARFDNFERLEELSFTDAKLAFVPPEIGQFHHLKTLIIGNREQAAFESNLLEKIPQEIGQLSLLTHLSICGTQLASLPLEISQLSNLTKLELDHNKLTVLPAEICSLSHLETLSVSNNQLAPELPPTVGQLTNLKLLDISGNQLKTLPSEIKKVKYLRVLDLSDNALEEFPYVITRLHGLNELYLGQNRIVNLPDDISTLTELRVLDVNNNELTSLSDSLFQIESLVQLDLYDNKLGVLPPKICDLRNLAILDVGNNQLSSLPEELKQMKKLTTLSLYNNNISTFPEPITQLESLKSLNLRDNNLSMLPFEVKNLANLELLEVRNNPLKQPPPEIVNQGLTAIKEYLLQIEQQENLDYLFEANLFVLGEPGSGKTSLVKKLLNPDFKLEHGEWESSTEGIDVHYWEFSMEASNYRQLNNTKVQKFRANIWDFGGQEIYYATHQLLLSKRALYVLVADAREQKTDFYFWLNLLEAFGGNSPVIVVLNEKMERTWVVNETALRSQFPNLREILTVNLATNRGIDNIKQSIQYHITNLPHIGQALPKSWIQVRQTLESDLRNTMPLDEYLELCANNGFESHNDKLQLSEYLHDLGTFLHFQDDPLLKKTIILKPYWCMKAIYRVLDNQTVIANMGQFTQRDLLHIWHEKTFSLWKDELLQLMTIFQICYPVPNQKGVYIAPQLLNQQPPQYEWDHKNNLILIYHYPTFMPKEVIPRFIVIMHSYIVDQRLVWRSGIILEREQAKVEVIEHYQKREIKIRVAGSRKRDLLTIVTYELDKIHEAYSKLKYDKLIPCNCTSCRISQSPHFYSFDNLSRRIAHQRGQVECPISYEMIGIRSLIDDIGMSEKDLLSKDFAQAFNLSDLSRKIRSHFNLQELKQLCFILEIEFDNLPGESMPDKAISLIQFCQRRGYTKNLVLLLQEQRPQVNWELG